MARMQFSCVINYYIHCSTSYVMCATMHFQVQSCVLVSFLWNEIVLCGGRRGKVLASVVLGFWHEIEVLLTLTSDTCYLNFCLQIWLPPSTTTHRKNSFFKFNFHNYEKTFEVSNISLKVLLNIPHFEIIIKTIIYHQGHAAVINWIMACPPNLIKTFSLRKFLPFPFWNKNSVSRAEKIKKNRKMRKLYE